jgi:hypothetical protein
MISPEGQSLRLTAVPLAAPPGTSAWVGTELADRLLRISALLGTDSPAVAALSIEKHGIKNSNTITSKPFINMMMQVPNVTIFPT